jgi:adenylate cyclase
MAWPRLPTIRLSELRRRRVFRAVGAYVVIGWLLLQVADVTFAPLGLPDWSQRALIIAVAVGVVPAAVLAWIFDLTRHGVVRTAAADDAAPGERRLVSRAGPPAPALPGTAPLSPIAAVAVLPFADLSQAGDHLWFCDGLAEEIIDSLCCVRGLRVASRTASFRFRDGSVDPREIGRQLSVDAILEGSVRVSGERMRVTAQLVDAQDGYHAWSETYERPVSDVFAVQREIAEKVADALKLSIAGAAFRGEKYAPANLQAYEFYVRGRQMVWTLSERAFRDAPGLFRRAIALDPDYAQAHAGLADALAQNVLWRFAPAAEVLPEATAAASRALDLAPDLAEAHVAQGHLRSLGGDNEGAQRAFERAIALNPGLYEAWYYFGRHAFARADYPRAAELFLRAFALRPDDFTLLSFAGFAVASGGDMERGRAITTRAAEGLLHQCELEPDNPRAHYMAAGNLQRVGRDAEARPLAERALALRPDDFSTLYNVACYYSQTGEVERALDLLEQALQRGGGYFDWIRNDKDLLPLHGHPRFEALLSCLRDRPDTLAKS